ncbi:class I SAM-dependent methyltransferase [Promicromonospora sp. NPDC060271]|uniref:class I SAM-dependent methyltransferase n=1 Tax=Promicromonospora sp. NPDC060271 TaxID=3347089 RepID=UPI00365985FF
MNNGPRSDTAGRGGNYHAFYRALADETRARRIFDLGCGTGLLTRSFATAGRHVVGIDPSATMLEHARSRPGAEAVTWVHGDASALPADAEADLLVCTGNAIMHVSPDELSTTLGAAAAALRPGGVVAFETRNPDAREWERWTRETTYGERTTHLGLLREWIEVTSATDGRVVFDAHNVLPNGEDRIYTSVLYFRDEATVRTELTRAGFERIQVFGGWHEEPVASGAGVLVFRAQRA